MFASSSLLGMFTVETFPADLITGVPASTLAMESILPLRFSIAFWISPSGPRASNAAASLAFFSETCSLLSLSANTLLRLVLNCCSSAAALYTSYAA